MEEMARRRRPAASVMGPARSSVAATTTFIVRAEKDTSCWLNKMRELYKFLTNGKDWGEGWITCIAEWVEVEGIHGFPVDVKSNPNVGAFSATTCPEPVGRWIAYKRTAKDRLVGSLKAYSSTWWAWWGDCQPEEHGIDQKGRPGPPAEDLDWSCMDVTISCGLVLIIISLSFWGAEVFKAGGVSSQQAQEWHDAVAQAILAFTSIRRWKLDSEGDSVK
ncbi:hypothetical protein EWM64_g7594 [Hericium alpestre]|uniref:Uncharacterized protein n=1 Tax=Hericium alpestre TaxID=135208 RepID=A0A4Y9ZSF8_9AGAM|nr:hypothetical protein EWM64_g7594 [Hericium alpestre]